MSGVQLVLMTRAEVDALQRLVACAQSQAAYAGDLDRRATLQATMQVVNHLAESAAVKRANEALGMSVKWDRAGRVYFGLSPAAASAITTALERTRPFWDGERRAAGHVRWFLRRLS